MLLHMWNLPYAMTRKQSCCSERCCSRSGRQSCCSDVGPDLAYLEFSPRFMVLESSSLLRSQVSRAHLRFHQQVFFLSSHQSHRFRNFITQFYVWSLAHQRGSVLRYSSILCFSYLSQARFCTDRYVLLQQYLEYSSITACLQHYQVLHGVIFTLREGDYNMN